mmetsp:Transcript_96812/g.269204  ORF Transcript_96812/g.269204 Transcript_96812/m.269204 type:complete len:175 (-) Transcript_96812:234-758(-)
MGNACCSEEKGGSGGPTTVQTVPPPPVRGPKMSLEDGEPQERASPGGLSTIEPPSEPRSHSWIGRQEDSPCSTIGEPPLPHVATLRFKRLDGEEVDVVVTQKPLGVDFKKSVPLPVKAVRPGSIGEQLHIQTGWVLLAVNHQGIADVAFETAYAVLKETLSTIPGEEHVPGGRP